MNDWHNRASKEVVETLNSNINQGLTTDQVTQKLEEYGHNELKDAESNSWLKILLTQFKDVMIVILILAAVVSFVVGEHTDAYVILAIIIGNAIIGFVQEYNAEQSVKKLKQMAAQHAMVVRNGQNSKIEVKDLVPGDIVLLEAGDIVPADARLVDVNGLKTEEAALTGESEAVAKQTSALDEEDLLPGDKLNMVFKGTIVSKGSAKAIVTGTGMKTEIGKIAEMLEGDTLKTPLQIRLANFSKKLAVFVIIICAVVFGLGLLRDEPLLKMFLTALSLAVAALPEALPAVITIGLAGGAKRMVRQKALIRKLPAVETLGSVTYICSDKTGTLTQNKMTVTEIEAADDNMELLQHAMMLNNEIKKGDDGDLLGDSTEKGIVNHVLNEGGAYSASADKYPVEGMLPFDSDRMMMSTLHKDGGDWILLVKGAPGKVAEQLDTTEEEKEKWLHLNRKWAAEGLRVLFFAYKKLDKKPEELEEGLESGLQLLGAVGMIDPPREEVLNAINECKEAGIKVVMITGDQPVTAKAIAKELNIADEDSEVLTGADMKKMSEEELAKHILNVRVYARVSPEQKVQIVEALQKQGQFVSMTGDGVNDAPSLKNANIGVAMGQMGTDVSKEAAHMVLLDDNFATIVKAVKEGRRIYDNIRRFVLYILACNLGEILTILVAPLLGLPLPLLPIHILWINLVTDGLPGLALANEPPEKNIMKRPPVPPQENLFARGVLWHTLFTGLILAGVALAAQYWADMNGYENSIQQTIVFSVLCFGQLLNAMSVRSANKSVLTTPLFSNPLMLYSVAGTIALQFALIYVPFMQPIFSTAALNGDMLIAVGLLSVVALVIIELIKWFYYRKAQMKAG